MNLQDGVLNQIRKENAEIRIVLLDGSEFRGRVRGFDNFTVAVEDDRTHRLVYKHAIAQIIHPKVAGPGRQPRGPREDPEVHAARAGEATGSEAGEGAPAEGAAQNAPSPQQQQPREPRGDRERGRNRERRGQDRRNEPRGGGASDTAGGAHKATFNPLDLSKLKLEDEAKD